MKRLQEEFFSINIDESTVLKTSQLAITVRYFHRGYSRVVSEHYKTVDIQKKDADSLVAVLHSTFTADDINYKKQLIAIETDSCPAMRGIRDGLIVKMQNSLEYIYDLGGCPDHHIANALKYGFKTFGQELKDTLVDLYYDIEKYPTHQKRYREACQVVGIECKPMLRMVETRWTVLETCAGRIVEQFAALEHMYGTMVQLSTRELREAETNRLYRLVHAFSGHTTPVLKLTLLFLQHAAQKFNVCVKVLEREEPMIHVQHKLIGQLIHDHMSTFLKPSVLQEAETYKALLTIDYKAADNQLPRKSMVLPTPVKRLMEDLEISHTTNAPVFEKFTESVVAFKITCTEKMLHYCKIQLTSKIVISLSALDPARRSDDGTDAKMLYLHRKFANVIPYSQRDILVDEIHDYQSATLADIPVKWYKEDKETDHGMVVTLIDISVYWARVAELQKMNIQDGDVVSEQRFPLLCKLAQALLSIHHSAAEVERTFSVEKEILTLKRNKMSQNTFNAHMLIRNNVKSSGGCVKVKQSITAGMRKAYVNAHATRKTYLAKQSEETSKEKKVLEFTHKRKVKEATSHHKHKLRELCKVYVQRKREEDEAAKKKAGEKRASHGGNKKQKTQHN